MSHEKIQEILICPITQTMLNTPVLTVVGQTYEQHDIAVWFSTKDTDPLTLIPLDLAQKILISNRFAENLITKLKEKTRFYPKDFTCPLTQELLLNPVTTSEGYTYDQVALENYFATRGDFDPISKKPIKLINGQKFVSNFCAKQCTELYQEGKEENKKIEQALKQKDFDFLSKVDEEKFREIFRSQSPEERCSTVKMLITHLQPKLLGYLYDNPTVDIENDKLFFSSFNLMQEMSKGVIYPTCDPLYKGDHNLKGGYRSLPIALKILSDAIEAQRERQDAFRQDLQEDVKNAGNYSPDETIFHMDAKDEDNNTLLHLAVQHHNLPLIQWLLKNGADCTQKNQQGQSPGDCAITDNNKDVVQLFIENGIIADQSINSEYEKTWTFKVLTLFNKYIPKLIELLSSLIPEIDKLLKESDLSEELRQRYSKRKLLVEEKMIENQKKKEKIHDEHYPPVLMGDLPASDKKKDTKSLTSDTPNLRLTML